MLPHVPHLRISTSRGDLMGMAVPTYYSADIVRAIPDDCNRYETVHGELLVTPAPRAWHQVVATRLLLSLGNYLSCNKVGELISSPADISWGPDTLVQPDVFVVDLDEARTLDWSRMQTLLLAVEVLSPSTARRDRFTKRRLYQEVGIPLYWIVDPDVQAVEEWTPDARFPTVQRERVTWQLSPDTTPFTLELSTLFRPI